MKSLGWTALVIAILAVIVIVLMHPPADQPQGLQSRELLQRGPYAVETEPFDLVDKNRKTAANGEDFKGLSYRELKGDIWRPLSEPGHITAYPLLVYSHGFMSFRSEGTYLAEFLASHGYIVIAADFPLTNYFAPGGPYLGDVINQPGDVSFLINYMLERNLKSGDSLYQHVDPQRIGVIGMSLGGMTTELVTFDRRLRDDRIRAAVSIAGPARMFNEKFFSAAKVPFMMIATDTDAVVYYGDNAAPVRQRDPDSVLVTIKGGSHTGFPDIAAMLFRWVNNPDTYGCSSIKGKVERSDSPFASLVDESVGVIKSERIHYCENYKHLPRAMRPARQHMYTTLATYSFFESIFNNDATQREKSSHYLLQTLAEENNEVSVSAGDYLALRSINSP